MHGSKHRFAVVLLGLSLVAGGCSTPEKADRQDEPTSRADAVSQEAVSQEAVSQEAVSQEAVNPRVLDAKVTGWTEENRRVIDELLASHAGSNSRASDKPRTVAVFDWDNTVIKNDVGDATMEWMIAHNLIAQPPARDWSKTNPALSEAAQRGLSTACDDAGEPGQWMTTADDGEPNACGEEIWQIYSTSTTSSAEEAWTDETSETMHHPYAWVAQLQAGHTPDEVRAFAASAVEERLEAPTDSGRYIRIYEPMRDLIGAMTENGFEVWVVTASPQHVVDALSERAGVPAERVIGIRNVVQDGKLTYALQACGRAASGDNTMMTYDVGKRCWINKVIFELPKDEQLSIPQDPSLRPVFAAGDSDTDVGMLVDATDLRLVIDRHKNKVMCHAQQNEDGHWYVQPMFIEPKPARPEPYVCADTD